MTNQRLSGVLHLPAHPSTDGAPSSSHALLIPAQCHLQTRAGHDRRIGARPCLEPPQLSILRLIDIALQHSKRAYNMR